MSENPYPVQSFEPYPPIPPHKNRRTLIIGIIVGGILLVLGIIALAIALVVSNVSDKDVQVQESSPATAIPSNSSTESAEKESGGALGLKSNYPATWGQAPFLPYQTVDDTLTDEDVMADLNSKLRMDTFTATDAEILNVTKSFCYAYEKGDDWNTAAVEFMMIGDQADVDTNASNLAYNVNLMGYAAAHFYCPSYEADIKQELLEAQKK